MNKEQLFRSFRSFSYRFIADVLMRLVQAGVGILLANYLGAAESGRYNLVYSLVFIMVVLSDLGAAPILTRELSQAAGDTSEKRCEKLLGSTILLKHLWHIGLYLMLALLMFQLPSLQHVRNLLLIALISIFFNWSYLLGAVFESRLRLEIPALIQLIFTFLNALFVLLLIYLRQPLWLFVVLRTGLAFPEALMMFRFSGKLIRRRNIMDAESMKYVLKESWPLLASNVCIVLYLRVDQVILDACEGSQSVGVYAAAVNIVEPLWIFAIAFMTVMAPTMARLYTEQRDVFEMAYRFCFKIVNIVAWPIAFGSLVMADSVITLLYHEEFFGAAIPLTILLWGNIFNYLGIVNNKLLIVSHAQHYDFVFTGSSLVVNTLLNLLLIPKWGIQGAAVASLTAYATGPLMGLYFPATKEYSRAMFVTAVKPALASAVLLLILRPLTHAGWLLPLIAIPLYIVFLLVLRVFNSEERQFLQQAIATFKNE